MKAYEYIKAKQTQWALNRGIALIGSKVDRGSPAYTPELNQNLFVDRQVIVKLCTALYNAKIRGKYEQFQHE